MKSRFRTCVCCVVGELLFSHGEAAASAGLLLSELVDHEAHVKSSVNAEQSCAVPAAQTCRVPEEVSCGLSQKLFAETE